MHPLARAFLASLIADKDRPEAEEDGTFLEFIDRLISDYTVEDDTAVRDALTAWAAAGYPLDADIDDVCAALKGSLDAMEPMARRIAARELCERLDAIASGSAAE